jgi:hypothetical protein
MMRSEPGRKPAHDAGAWKPSWMLMNGPLPVSRRWLREACQQARERSKSWKGDGAYKDVSTSRSIPGRYKVSLGVRVRWQRMKRTCTLIHDPKHGNQALVSTVAGK